jgi:hypothetical protein
MSWQTKQFLLVLAKELEHGRIARKSKAKNPIGGSGIPVAGGHD